MSARRGTVPVRIVLAGLLVATLVVAGVVSFYASSHPDGLDRVSQDEGFASTATEHGASDSPLADYGVAGVDDDRLSSGLAGVLGAGLVLLLTGGVAYAVRRRGTSTGATSASPADTADTDDVVDAGKR